MKTLKEKIEVMQAALEGKPIEVLGPAGCWPTTLKYTEWNWSLCDYRVATGTPDEIDWSLFADNWKYMARHGCGMAVLYERAPSRDDILRCWMSDGAFRRIDGLFKDIYKRGDRPWNESLVERSSDEQRQ